MLTVEGRSSFHEVFERIQQADFSTVGLRCYGSLTAVVFLEGDQAKAG